jgi:hypothetical protein
VKNWDRRAALQLSLRSGSLTSMTTLDGAPAALRIGGLPFGSYTVTARVPGGAGAREAKTAVLDAGHPEAAVDLELINNDATLTLRDDAGAPVANASILIAPLGVLPEISPGVYALRGFPLGAELPILVPGFAPICGIVGTDHITATLARGRQIEVVFAVAAALGDVPPGDLVFGSGASRCAVPLSRFGYSRLQGQGEARFVIQNFPPGERVVWHDGSKDVPLVVPTTGPLVIR